MASFKQFRNFMTLDDIVHIGSEDLERLKRQDLRLSNGYILVQGDSSYNAFAVLEATKENNIALYALLRPMQKEIEQIKGTFMFSNTHIIPYSRCGLDSLDRFKEAFYTLGYYSLGMVRKLIRIADGKMILYEYCYLQGLEKWVLVKMHPSSICRLSEGAFYMNCNRDLKDGFDKFCGYVNNASKDIVIEGAKVLIKEDMPFHEIAALYKNR